ncbi:MAG: HAD-IA family hydrolase [Syntrophomonas sp.]
MKFKVNVVVFDFDGVIIDSGADIASAAQDTLKVFNRPVLSKDEIISYVGHGAEVLIRKCFKDCSEEVIEQAIPFYKKYYLDNALIETKLYPNVKETLKVIKEDNEDKKIALVTNKPEEITKKILAGLGIRQYFDLIMGPESVKKIKPDPEGIRKVLDTFGIAAEKAIMVGDSYVDVEAGRNAGTNTCGVTYGLGNKEDLIKAAPDFYISDMSQLLEHIE